MKAAELPIISNDSDSFEDLATENSPSKGPKIVKKRKTADTSQRYRSIFQIGFLLLNLIIGIQFFLWVRYFETGGQSWQVSRPAGVEGWLPIASLMNLKAWLLTGELPLIHPAGMFILLAIITISFLLRKSFCGWLCPIGTLSETLWRFGQKVFTRNFQLPKWLDIPLRSLKYILMALFLLAVGSMSVEAIRQFLDGPYGVVADVKMLNFFRFASVTAVEVVLVLVLLSLLVKNFWCRYLCPYGALLGLFSWLSPARITRNTDACVECGKCSKVCPARLPVAESRSIRSPECFGCYQCVSDCQVEGALQMTIGRKTKLRPIWFATAVFVIFMGFVIGARITDSWHTQLPDKVYFELIPNAERYSHP